MVTVWFWALFLVAHDRRGISAPTLSRELEVSYKTAWLLLHKIRCAMQKREQQYVLTGIVEKDEAYFGDPRQEPTKGRGTNKKPVLLAMALTQHSKPKYLKMKALSNVKSKTISDFVDNGLGADVRHDSE